MSPEDYDQHLKSVFMAKQTIVKDSQQNIMRLVKEVQDALKVDKKSIAWKNYNDYVNCILIDGIAAAIQTALTHLNQQIDPDFIRKNDIGPLFDIKLELNPGSGIVFEPDIEENSSGGLTVRNVLKGWINDFFFIAKMITRLDTT